jgi:hypothetical protein
MHFWLLYAYMGSHLQYFVYVHYWVLLYWTVIHLFYASEVQCFGHATTLVLCIWSTIFFNMLLHVQSLLSCCQWIGTGSVRSFGVGFFNTRCAFVPAAVSDSPMQLGCGFFSHIHTWYLHSFLDVYWRSISIAHWLLPVVLCICNDTI